jgi:carbon-monoxide dehydrogenase large subunit
VFGARLPRKEDARLVTGRGRYVSDVEVPRMLHVAFVRSVHAHARIRGVETTAAAAAPGVVAVVTGLDPDFAPHRVRALSALPTYVATEQPILAGAKARFAGEAVAAVVARDRYAAEDSAGLVRVDYEPLPAVVDIARARGDRAVLHDAAPDNVLLSRRFEGGDVEAALAGSAVVVERAFRTNRQTAAPLEGRTGTRPRASSRSGPARRSRTWRATAWPACWTSRRAASGWWRRTWAAASG